MSPLRLVNIQFTSIFQLYIKPTYITNGYFNIVIFYLFLYFALTKISKALARAFIYSNTKAPST